ncbi:MAG: hypothetical protein MN733_23210 [Nitrososphaera sp.]|nr:hypothetical protein [Nitrososphaera sp.]
MKVKIPVGRIMRGWGVLGIVATIVVGVIVGYGVLKGGGTELQSTDPFEAIIDATETHSLVALGEYHQMQQWHDFMGELLLRREFTENVDDFVVEFGNALYQDVADRFLLELEQVPFAELSQIWRNTSGGGILWDAPVYEQFFRNVRHVNEGLPREQRIRVLLGDPDVDFSKVRSVADSAELDKGNNRDAFFAGVVEREVIAKGRYAVLIMGADHLRRGVHANTGVDHPNVATLLARQHSDELFIVYPLPFDYDEHIKARSEAELAASPKPAFAHLDGTWLSTQNVTHRALNPDSTFGDQVDAVIWFASPDSLTVSRADPEIYCSGEYAVELQRRSIILSEIFNEPIDFIAQGLRLATAGPKLYPEGSRHQIICPAAQAGMEEQ